MKDHLLIFVPGILGTELRYEREGDGPEAVWSGALQTLWYTLAKDARRLYSSTPLKVGSILRDFDPWPLGRTKMDVYGSLLDFVVRDLRYVSGADFLAWGYDWRQSNRTSAAQLASELRSKLGCGVRKFKFVCHSMGGLVVRLMLADPTNKDIADSSELVIQLGTPMRGAALAFRTLKDGPRFGGLFGLLFDTSFWFRARRFHLLMNAINTFDSLFELLPHESQQVLYQNTDFRCSAMDSQVWPLLPPLRLMAARDVHGSLVTSECGRFRTVYSDDIETEGGYLVDEHFDFMDVDVTQMINGDGVVGMGSATLGTEISARQVFRLGIRHDRLMRDQRVLEYLKKHL